MKKHKYFISYSHNHGFGNLDVEIDNLINCKDLDEIQSAIEEKSTAQGVVIINFIKL